VKLTFCIMTSELKSAPKISGNTSIGFAYNVSILDITEFLIFNIES